MRSLSSRPFVVLGVALWICSSTVAFASRLKPAQVPTFSIRGRIVAADPAALEGQKFSFNFEVPCTAIGWVGADWSKPMLFGPKQAAAVLKRYPATNIPGWPLVVRLYFHTIKEPTRVEAELTFDENKETIKLEADLMRGGLGILLTRDAEGKPQAATMATYNRRYWRAIGLDPNTVTPRPQHFPIIDRFIGGDNDALTWREGITELSRAGFNGIMLPADRLVRNVLLETGQRHTAWAVYSPPGYAFEFFDLPDAALKDWVHKQAAPYRNAGYDAKDISLFGMSDEPGWYYPQMFGKLKKHPPSLARFRKYLADQGLQPADVGHQTWDDVEPLGRGGAVDLPSKRLFYWTIRFFSWDSARYFARVVRTFEDEFYPGIPVFTNWNFFTGRFYVPGPAANNKDRKSPDAGMGGHDWFEFARLRGGTMLWTEDWFSDRQAYQWSFHMARLRSAARLGGLEYGGYIVPRTAGDRGSGIEQKILSVVGNGGKAIKYFVFGPEYNFPGNCYSERSHVMRGMARAHAAIARAEDVLWPGRPPRAEVAIVAPRSAFAWDNNGAVGSAPIQDATNVHLGTKTVDYAAEVFGTYLALQHANIPCDFVDEDGLTAEQLQPFKVIYLTEPCVPVEGQQALVAWMKAGGTLITVTGAAARDRYNEPCSTLSDATAIAERPRASMLVGNVRALKAVARGEGQPGPFTAFGARGEITLPEQANSPLKVRGKFEDGAPAIVIAPVGSGRRVHFAWLPGIAYLNSTNAQSDNLPVGFDPALRRYLTDAALAKTTPPVTVGEPLVEAPLLVSEAGAAITLLNWTGKPIDKLQVTARLPFVPKRIESVQHGPLTFQPQDHSVTFSTKLDSYDVIRIRP